MTCRPNCSYSKTFSQIDSIQEDFVRLSGYASQLSDVEPSKLCRSKTAKRIKEIHRLLMSIENEFFELRSMFDIDDDIDSEMAVTNEDIFNLIGDYSHNKNASKEQMFTSELTDLHKNSHRQAKSRCRPNPRRYLQIKQAFGNMSTISVG